MTKKKISVLVQDDIVATVDTHTENRSKWLREAIAEKLARDGDRKRHLHVDDPIRLELSEFEALWLSQFLWEQSDDIESGNRQATVRWWSRRLDAMRKTRDDGF